MPDILNGDPIIDFNDPSFDRAAWMAKHGPDSWVGPVDKVVAALKQEGVSRFGTTGFCFGAPPAFYLAFKNESHVTVLNHPSRLAVPDDLKVRTKQRPFFLLTTDVPFHTSPDPYHLPHLPKRNIDSLIDDHRGHRNTKQSPKPRC
jgi:dienelactone hydrolase